MIFFSIRNISFFGLMLLMLAATDANQMIWAPDEFQDYAIQGSDCARLRRLKPKVCAPMTAESRRRILALSQPARFPKTRYQLPPRSSVPVSKETDCTRFVHAIYTQAGHPVPQIPTDGFYCLSTFKVIPDSQALAGDLVLYPGHVGILEKSGKVVSATFGGRGRPSTLSTDHPKFVSSIQSVPRNLLARGPSRILRWDCKGN